MKSIEDMNQYNSNKEKVVSIKEIRELVEGSDLFHHANITGNDADPLHLDSMSMIWLITLLEERFNLLIDYRSVDLKHFDSVQSIHRFVSHELRGDS